MVLALHNGESPQKIVQVATDRGYNFPLAVDRDGSLHRAYGVTLRPTTVLIGPDGKVIAVRVGAHSLEQWQETIAGLKPTQP